MYLGPGGFTATEPYLGNPFAFSPTAAAITLAQPGNFSDAGASGDRLNGGDFAKNLEMHELSFQTTRQQSTILGNRLSGDWAFTGMLRLSRTHFVMISGPDAILCRRCTALVNECTPPARASNFPTPGAARNICATISRMWPTAASYLAAISTPAAPPRQTRRAPTLLLTCFGIAAWASPPTLAEPPAPPVSATVTPEADAYAINPRTQQLWIKWDARKDGFHGRYASTVYDMQTNTSFAEKNFFVAGFSPDFGVTYGYQCKDPSTRSGCTLLSLSTQSGAIKVLGRVYIDDPGDVFFRSAAVLFNNGSGTAVAAALNPVTLAPFWVHKSTAVAANVAALGPLGRHALIYSQSRAGVGWLRVQNQPLRPMPPLLTHHVFPGAGSVVNNSYARQFYLLSSAKRLADGLHYSVLVVSYLGDQLIARLDIRVRKGQDQWAVVGAGGQIYLTSTTGLHVYDPGSLRIVKTIPLPYAPDHIVANASHTVIYAFGNGPQKYLAAIDAQSQSIIYDTPLSMPGHVYIGYSGHLIFVYTSASPNALASTLILPANHSLVLPVGTGVDAAYYDKARSVVYIVHHSQLFIFNPVGWKLEKRVNVNLAPVQLRKLAPAPRGGSGIPFQ